MQEIFPEFRGRCELPIEPLDLEKLADSADVALCCLPHKVSMQFVPELLRAGVKVIDFSADYRIKDVTVYEQFYKTPHTDTANLAKAVYGLPELFRKQIKKTKLVANPGCFPTGSMLALAPLLKEGLVETELHHRQLRDRRLRRRQEPLGEVPLPEHEREHLRLRHRRAPAHARDGADRRRGGGLARCRSCSSRTSGRSTAACSRPCTAGPRPNVKSEQLLSLYHDFYKGEPFVQVCKAAPAVKDVTRDELLPHLPDAGQGRGRGLLRDRQPDQGRFRPGHPEHEHPLRPAGDDGARISPSWHGEPSWTDRGNLPPETAGPPEAAGHGLQGLPGLPGHGERPPMPTAPWRRSTRS